MKAVPEVLVEWEGQSARDELAHARSLLRLAGESLAGPLDATGAHDCFVAIDHALHKIEPILVYLNRMAVLDLAANRGLFLECRREVILRQHERRMA